MQNDEYGQWVFPEESLPDEIPELLAHRIQSMFGDIETLAWAANCPAKNTLKALTNRKAILILGLHSRNDNDGKALLRYLRKTFTAVGVVNVLTTHQNRFEVLNRLAAALDLTFEQFCNYYYDFDQMYEVAVVPRLVESHAS